ncbi:MAG TPA: circularly permuted type 2 ATP-grasp protein [Solirubrobacteraceae bacterium]|nr:circularly permuted type 2 ATP-grasp protein [Solirubrobacteraceae bacterium]
MIAETGNPPAGARRPARGRRSAQPPHEDPRGPIEKTLAGIDLTRLAEDVASDLRDQGVTFRCADGDDEFRVDPVPRVISAEAWAPLAAGLAQRVRALERFVDDAYGRQRIVEAGVVPLEAITTAEYFEPALVGLEHPPKTWIALAGLDVVRDTDGEFKVLEDNLRTPSGLAYAIAARGAINRNLPVPDGLDVHPLDDAFTTLKLTVRAAAPAGVDDPTIVVLTDGPHNAAHYEHQTIASQLDVPLVVPADLRPRAGRVEALIDGRHRPVDVIYRRTDEDRLFDPTGRLTPLGEIVHAALLAGRVSLVNAFGTGLADDKLLHAYVEEIVRFYLGEEPLLASVPTYDLSRPDQRAMVLDRIDELVIKPRGGQGGAGIVVCPHAEPECVARIAREVRDRPELYVAQEMVMLSRQPTVCEGRLEPRHVDLRPFVMARGDQIDVIPGGLTRVALDAGALVVNSSQNGGAKDTWVLR